MEAFRELEIIEPRRIIKMLQSLVKVSP